MSFNEIAISVRGLSKSYTIAHDEEKHTTLVETIVARLKNPLRKPKTETFWALKDINFDIKKGEVVGIIGRNGAGKSTLLKALSRITEPTTGEIDVFGRVGSLLEVGTGFHPELTGRENVFLNGAILGMSRSEIRSQFDAIVEFAGVETFLDTPVKRYSSGMYVRLAFAVAAHLGSEILIVDEVLAVGDSEFQKKCLGKMQDVASTGRTVLFVSHNMATVNSLCTRAILLRNGTVAMQGSVGDVLNAYLTVSKAAGGTAEDNGPAADDQRLKIRAVRVTDENYRIKPELDSAKPAYIEIDYEVLVAGRGYTLAVQVMSLQYGCIFTTSYFDVDPPRIKTDWWNTGKFRQRFPLPMQLMRSGDYTLEVASTIPGVQILDRFAHEVGFHIVDTNSPVALSGEGRQGAILPVINWESASLNDDQKVAG